MYLILLCTYSMHASHSKTMINIVQKAELWSQLKPNRKQLPVSVLGLYQSCNALYSSDFKLG